MTPSSLPAVWSRRVAPGPRRPSAPKLRRLPGIGPSAVLRRRSRGACQPDRHCAAGVDIPIAPGFSSGYLYQLYSYVRSQECYDDPRSLRAAGMLLHPSVEGDVFESAFIQDHEFRFATVDLAASGRAIRKRLLDAAIGAKRLRA